MNIQSIRKIAEEHNVDTDKLNKLELIRALQREEGNFDCYAKAYHGYCDQSECTWRDDCLSEPIRQNQDSLAQPIIDNIL